MPDLARIAYEAYCRSRGWLDPETGMSPWETLSLEAQGAWDAVGQAILGALSVAD